MKLAKPLFVAFLLLASVPSISMAAPTALSAAETLSKSMLPKDDYDRLFAQIMQIGSGAIRAQFESSGLKFDDAKHTKQIEEIMLSKFPYQYFITANSVTMKKKFNDKELTQILKFYDTVLGKKWQAETRNIVTVAIQGFQADFDKELPKVESTMVEKAKAEKAATESTNPAPVKK